MREGRPSFTAAAVAFGRAVGHRHDARDPMARQLLGGPTGVLLGAVEWAGQRGPILRGAVRAGSCGLVDHVSLRTACLDAAITRAVGAGVDQLVILGAGLDARAWRLPVLADVDVFELDFPATQARKQSASEGTPPVSRSLTFVPIDFEKQALEEVLATTGHDPSRPTFWLWEGVTMYLNRAAFEATLEHVVAGSAEESWLAASYMRPDPIRIGPLTRLAFRVMGEGLVGAMETAEMRRRLENHGFHVESDTDSSHWASEYGGSALLATPFRAERVVVSRR